SFASRASSGVTSGPATSSSGGLASDSTFCKSPNSSSSRSASTSHSGARRGKAVTATWPGIKAARRSRYGLGRKWLKTSIFMDEGSSGLRLRYLFKHAPFGLDSDRNQSEGGDQVGQGECIERPGAEPISEHEAHNGGSEE